MKKLSIAKRVHRGDTLATFETVPDLTREEEMRSTRDDEIERHRVEKVTNVSPGSVALACDWLTTPGGAEKVLLELHRMYPTAPIYTSQYRRKGITWFDDAEVRTGWLQIFPKSLRKFLGPLRQLYFSRLDLTSYDLVISVTGAEAKSLKAKTHLCYCHVPTQYYWQMYDKYVENPGFGILNPLVRLCFKLLVKPLRKADYAAAQKPTQFITISAYAAAQIKKYYHREATVIAPPIEIAKFSPRSAKLPPDPAQNSTENRELSTKNPQKSTTSPQEIHTPALVSPQHFHSEPQTFPPNPNVFPLNPSTFPQLFHNFSTDTPEKPNQTAQKSPEKHPTPTQRIDNVHTMSIQQPSDTPLLDPESPEKPFIIACRQVTWKRVDLAIEACLKAQKPLLVIGDGPEHKNLVKLAQTPRPSAKNLPELAQTPRPSAKNPKNPQTPKKLADNPPLITFLPWLDTPELAAHLQTASAYLFPSLEPFGIAAVEALAAGCPVIAYAEGGSRDFIRDHGPGKNGILFSEQTVESLSKALKSFDPADFDPATIRKSAEKFSPDIFQQKISTLVDEALKGKLNS